MYFFDLRAVVHVIIYRVTIWILLINIIKNEYQFILQQDLKIRPRLTAEITHFQH